MISEFYLLIAVVALFSLGLTLYVKGHDYLQHFLNFLLILITIQMLESGTSHEESSFLFTGIIGGLIGVNFLASSLIKTRFFRWLIPILSIICVMVFGKNELMYNEYSLDFRDIKVTGVILLGFLIGVLSYSVRFIFQKFFPENHHNKIQLTAQLIIVGFFIIPATFFIAWYGFLLLAVGFFLYDCYREHKNGNLIISLLSFATISHFLTIHNVESIDLSIGKIIAGLIIGGGIYLLGSLSNLSSNRRLSILLLLSGIALAVLLSLLSHVHPSYGGVESFIAALFGMAFINIYKTKNIIGNILFPAFLAIGILLPIDPITEINPSNKPIPTQEIKEEKETTPKGLDASSLTGKYIVVSENSNISFQLGPKGGITKGAIKNFEGNVDFGNNINSAKFNIKLPIKNLTTFNSMRDESIMSLNYLNEEKFPVMLFSSSQTDKKDDGYLLTGDFTLLGKTNKETIFIRYEGEVNGLLLFSGKGAINRTKYGMASSPQEGNVVDFTFSIELKQD